MQKTQTYLKINNRKGNVNLIGIHVRAHEGAKLNDKENS